MTGLERWQDAISQNIANSGVSGYKGINVSMHSSKMPQADAGDDFGSTLGTHLVKAEASVSYDKGTYVQSGNELDCAIEGDGFFQVDAGNGLKKYTRDGQFRIDNENTLVTAAGETVLGTTGRITFSAGGGEARIDNSGNVYQGETVVGKLAVFNVKDKSALIPAGGGYTTGGNDDAAGVTAAENATIMPGYTEGSNVSAMREMVNMINVSRAYEANSKVISSQDTMLGKATQAFSV